MQMLIRAEGQDITMKAKEPVEMSRHLAASLIRSHARLIGRLAGALEDGIAARFRSSLSLAYIAVMAGRSPAGRGACRADMPVSIVYDTVTEEAGFVDGSLPENPTGALMLIFVRLAGILAGDIDYVLFSDRILESYDRGVAEGTTMADKAKEE